MKKKYLVTGSAGFVGSALCKKLLSRGDLVYGIDNHNDYYDPKLKESRVNFLVCNENYKHFRLDIIDQKKLNKIFEDFSPQIVIHLAAQAGVRYSIENPHSYVNTNIHGYLNILESCRYFNIEHLVYASTSSVYGANTKMPFSEEDSTNHPLSIYAASKKSNELMAHSYSHLFNLPTTGLRFFTVYGPWGRPDMALFKFTQSIIEDREINVFNNGNHTRDFTYIDDIVNGITKILNVKASGNSEWNSDFPNPASSKAPWRIYNIGNNNPIKLMEYIKALEASLGKKAKINYLPLQPGDISDTSASITKLQDEFNYLPKTNIEEGIKNFVRWYLNYFQ